MCDINDMNDFERENEEFWNAVAEREQQKWDEYTKKYGIYICIDGMKNVIWQNGGELRFGGIYSCKLPVDTEGLIRRNIISAVYRDNSKYITKTPKNCVDCEYFGNVEDNPNHFYCTLYDMTMPSENGCCTCFEERKNHEQEPREK